jgi:23S rRNA G2445 N2-methylase RlmL
LHTVPGLEELLAEELRERVPAARVLRTVRGFDERTSLLVVGLRGEPAPLLGLRLAEDAFALGVEVEDVPGGWSGLRALRDAVSASPLLEMAAARAMELRPKRARRVTFRVVARVAGSHAFRRVDAQQAVETAIGERFREWRVVEENAQLELWLHLVGGLFLLGVRLSDERMRRHAGLRVSLPAALKPAIAAAMVRLSRPQEDDMFLDPMCGAGTILIERGEAGRYRQLLGGDADPEAVAATLANIGPRYKPIEVRQWDARRLPLADASVTRIVSNMPFGRQVGSPAENRALYPALLNEWARVLRPGGRMVLLTSESALLARALRGLPLTPGRRLPLLVRGHPAAMHEVNAAPTP